MPHRRERGSHNGVPVIALDYAEIGPKSEEGSGAGYKLRARLVRDCTSKMTFAHSFESKKFAMKYLARRVLEDLEVLGYGSVVLKTDGEHHVRTLTKTVNANPAS